VSSLQFVEEIGCVVSASHDGTVKFLACDSLQELGCIADHTQAVNAVVWGKVCGRVMCVRAGE
jgi:hypothetical protein